MTNEKYDIIYVHASQLSQNIEYIDKNVNEMKEKFIKFHNKTGVLNRLQIFVGRENKAIIVYYDDENSKVFNLLENFINEREIEVRNVYKPL